MEFPAILPGEAHQQAVERDGCSEIEYAYRSERGQLFCCTAKSLEDAQAQCERWLVAKERHSAI